MLYSHIPILLPALAYAAPVVEQRAAAPSPTLMTFEYLGQHVTATYFGTSSVANPPCPTMTFTYLGAAITRPYEGPGTPQSCLGRGNGPAPTTVAPATTTPRVTSTSAPQPPVLNQPDCQAQFRQCVSSGTSQVACECRLAACAGQDNARNREFCASATASLSTMRTTTASSTPTSTSTSSIVPASGPARGFNYGAQGQNRETFLRQFNLAKSLPGFGQASARLYTMIQEGTANDPIGAIEAAISTNTTLLLGLFYSPQNVNNELTALSRAIQQYGSAFTNLVTAISVGSEDLYRNSPTGIAARSNPGANPNDIVEFIRATRRAIAGTALASKPVGHVDTWTAWVNASNTAVIQNSDFLGFNAFPYFQDTQANSVANSVANGRSLFDSAYQQTVAVAQGKPVWITETGWPTTGETFGEGMPSVANAQRYWNEVACGYALGRIPTYWYILGGGTSQGFGVTDGSRALYDLSCAATV